ncbi:MAG: Ig-like domain-containing protein, partial [Erysipelotrichaceae bacterium]
MNKLARILLTWILVTIIALSRGMITLQAHDDEDHINPHYDLHFDIDGKANQGSGIGIYEIHDYTQHDATVWPQGFNLTEHTQANDFVAFYEALNGVTITAEDRSDEGKYFDGWEFLSIQINHGDIRFIGITAHWTCTPPNTAPQANASSFSVNEGASYIGLLTGNDLELDPLLFSKVSNPAHGTVTVNPNGTFTYNHDGSETLTDSFTFRVFDGFLYSSPATVSITINPVNDAPVANDDSFTIAEAGTYGGTLSASDVDGGPLSFSVDTSPSHGSVLINPNGTYSYTHDGTETLSDSFTFKVYDGALYDYATVFITVTAENDPPVTLGDTITVNEGATISNHPFDMSDPEGNALVVSIVDWPVHGLLTNNGDGTFTYAHDGTETLSDSFTFKAFDGQYYSNISTVSITVTPVNDAPVSSDYDFYLAENGTINEQVFGSDPDSSVLTYERIGDPSHGSLTFYSDGTFTYTQDGSETTFDSFTYRVYDGALYSGTATVNLYISNVNDAPVADNSGFTVDEGAFHNGTLTGSDADLDSLTFEKVTDPSNGSVTINSDGSYTYTHNGSETSSDSFTFRVWDGLAYSTVATITITVDPVNDAPVAFDDLFNVNEGEAFDDSLTATDIELDSLIFELVSGPSHGTLDLHADGTFTYTHDGSETISDTFTFRVWDGQAYSNDATATIIINPVNDAPVAYDNTFYLTEGGSLSDFMTGFDIEGDPLSFSLMSSPSHGFIDYNPLTGAFTYVHDGSETSLDSFTFIV